VDFPKVTNPTNIALKRSGAEMADTGGRENDFKLLTSYQSFSTEVVRISLLGIGAVGTLYTLKPEESPTGLANATVQCTFIAALIALAAAVTFALLHRYCATDFMACQLRLDRLRNAPPANLTPEEVEVKIQAEKRSRRIVSCLSFLTIWGGPVFMAIGAICLAFAFGRIIILRS
jgi:hypothetical protein